MLFKSRHRIEIATGLLLGDRSYQEDSVGFFEDPDRRFVVAVLSDGIGGQDHGHLSSRIVQKSALDYISSRYEAVIEDGLAPQELLTAAAEHANASIRKMQNEAEGEVRMGATLVIALILGRSLYWLSVGDSLLRHFSGTKLRTLNKIHNLSTSLDFLRKSHGLGENTAQKSALRGTLTSAVTGGPLKEIDCPGQAMILKRGDLVVLASDGIQTIPDDQIVSSLKSASDLSAAERVSRIISEVDDLSMIGQDNLSVCMIVTS